ncbi:hypothetical protein M9H77_31726 [Catharanthus roseus]|uniref:Uncharacterized protein n=1 Tax=Catharanthus roseus TaxID=4058 RepID=A0ACC0A2Z1_CATRO|nr:hypothetical protein M9H77_31726 [Catharanthus roseus]
MKFHLYKSGFYLIIIIGLHIENRRRVTDRLLRKVVLQEMLKKTLSVRVFFMLLVQILNSMQHTTVMKRHLILKLNSLKIHDKYKLVGLHIKKKYTGGYDPFILSQQAEQVTYVLHPTPK